MMVLAMPVSVMFVLQEEVLIATVGCECHGRDAEARKGALESVPPGEDALVPPCLSAAASAASAAARAVDPGRGSPMALTLAPKGRILAARPPGHTSSCRNR